MTNNIAIELQGIKKSFGTIKANDGVDLTVRKGEILALLGENGSGKTTLMNMISGIYHPDSGTIKVNGKEVAINSPKDSFDLGIGMVHQHFKLVDVFTAKENIEMGYSGKKNFKKELQRISSLYGLTTDADKIVSEMSVSEKQTVEILKVIYRGAEILILDEPTAVLTPQETKRLFKILRNMKDNGCAIIIITHKLNEVLEISDRVTILRKGKTVGSVITSETNSSELTNLMVGRKVDLLIERPETKKIDNFFEVHHLTVKNGDTLALKDVNFDIKGGEILGVAGVAGSGQKELCETIAGLQKAEEGAILFNKKNIIGNTPSQIIKQGISMSFIPEDRLGMGLVATMGIVDNLLLKSYNANKGILVDKKPAKELADKLVEELEISTPSVNTPVKNLSGGNVQKVLLGREIKASPQVIVTAYPVRGLDVNSSYIVYDLLNEEKKRGVAVLFIGEDLDVLLSLCDRIMVLCHGEVTGIVDAKSVTKEQIGLLMTGQKQEEVFTDA